MGEGIIQSGGKGGYYSIEIVKNLATAIKRKAAIAARIASLVTVIATTTTELTTAQTALSTAKIALQAAILSAKITDIEKAQAAVAAAQLTVNAKQRYLNLLKLEQESLNKEKALLDIKASKELAGVWCADLSERLSRTVGTLEINGEAGVRKHILIMPGGATGAGKIEPSENSTPAGVFYNWAVLPAWQKVKPTYRTGVLTSINFTANTCTVSLDPAVSSVQSFNINQAAVLSGVPIVYMTCNAGAFVVGDKVVVKFEGQNQTTPKVIGFVSNPRGCYMVLEAYSELDGTTVDIAGVQLFYRDPGGTYLMPYTQGVDFDVTITRNRAEIKQLKQILTAHILIIPSTAYHLPWYVCNAEFSSSAAYISGGSLPASGVTYKVKLPYYKPGVFTRTGITTYDWESGQLPGGYYFNPLDGYVFKSTAPWLPALSVFMVENNVNHVHRVNFDTHFYTLPLTLQVSWSGTVKSASVRVYTGGGMGIYGLGSLFFTGDGTYPAWVNYSPAALWEITSNIPALNETFLNPDFAFAHYLQGEVEADGGSITVKVSASGGSGAYDQSRMYDGVIDAGIAAWDTIQYLKNTI